MDGGVGLCRGAGSGVPRGCSGGLEGNDKDTICRSDVLRSSAPGYFSFCDTLCSLGVVTDSSDVFFVCQTFCRRTPARGSFSLTHVAKYVAICLPDVFFV